MKDQVREHERTFIPSVFPNSFLTFCSNHTASQITFSVGVRATIVPLSSPPRPPPSGRKGSDSDSLQFDGLDEEAELKNRDDAQNLELAVYSRTADCAAPAKGLA
jgi:hypothetical protein